MQSIPAWNRCVLLLLVTVAAYFQTWRDLWPFWENRNATYTHGSLVALIAIWLVWRTRASLKDSPLAVDARALPLVLLLSAIWLLAARANLFMAYVVLWPLLALSILWAGAGWRTASKFAFPLGFLYFAIPVWEYLKPPLQAIASLMVGTLTSWAGVPAVVEGPIITLPSSTIFIALDCSGAHFLSVALAVGVLAGEFRGDKLGTRLIILAVAAALSMVFNWLRILLIIFAYLHPDLRHGMETMGHLTFGWWVFAFDLVVFYLVLRWVPSTASEDPPVPATAFPTPHASPAAGGALWAIAAALLFPLSSWAAQSLDRYPQDTPAPLELPGMAGPIAPDGRWEPRFLGSAWEHRVAYIWPDGRVLELYRNEYHRQVQGRELIADGTPLFEPSTFVQRTSAVVTLQGEAGQLFNLHRVELTDRAGRSWAAVYTYLVGNETIANASRAQLAIALQSLYRRPTAGVLALITPCTPDCTVAESALGKATVDALIAYRNGRPHD